MAKTLENKTNEKDLSESRDLYLSLLSLKLSYCNNESPNKQHFDEVKKMFDERNLSDKIQRYVSVLREKGFTDTAKELLENYEVVKGYLR